MIDGAGESGLKLAYAHVSHRWRVATSHRHSMKVFLSSAFRSRDDETSPDVLALRTEIRDSAERFGIEILLAENDDGVRAAADRGDDIGVLAGCARVARDCHVFVALLHQRHGQGMQLFDTLTAVSIFETELLHASMSRKPVLVLHVDDFLPSKPLGAFLQLVDPVLGPCRHSVKRADIVAEIAAFVRDIGPALPPRGAGLFDLLGWARIRPSQPIETIDPQLLFLGGAYRAAPPAEPDLGVVRAAFEALDAGSDAAGVPLSQVAKLSLLWIVIRQFAGADENARHGAYAGAWTDALGRWSSAAAWYGLHGAHPLGCLAALNTISAAHRQAPSVVKAPHGARSSAYYSVAAKSEALRTKRRYFRQALALAERETSRSGGLERAAALGMRASCHARLYQVGARSHALPAFQDYREALRLRERLAAGSSEVGESRTEYAFILSKLPGQRRAALRLMDEGIQEMRAAPDFGERIGFLVRGERKYAQVLAAARDREGAIALLEMARTRADGAGLEDQVEQIRDELAKVRGCDATEN